MVEVVITQSQGGFGNAGVGGQQQIFGLVDADVQDIFIWRLARKLLEQPDKLVFGIPRLLGQLVQGIFFCGSRSISMQIWVSFSFWDRGLAL